MLGGAVFILRLGFLGVCLELYKAQNTGYADTQGGTSGNRAFRYIGRTKNHRRMTALTAVVPSLRFFSGTTCCLTNLSGTCVALALDIPGSLPKNPHGY